MSAMDGPGIEKQQTKRKRILAAVAALLILFLVVLFSRAQPAKPGGPGDLNSRLLAQVRDQPTPVVVETVHYGAIQRVLNVNGTIQSSRSANVSAAVPGQVLAVFVSEGSRVRAGAALAQINPSQSDAQAAQSRQGVEAARSQYAKALSGRDLTARQTAGDVERAQIGVREALLGLSKANSGAGAASIRQAEDSAQQARAAAQLAARALARTRFLYEHGIVPPSTFEEVRTKAEQAAAGADAADAAVRQAREGAVPEDRRLAAEKVAEARQGLQAAVEAQRGRNAIADADVQSALTQVRSAQEGVRLAQLQQVNARIVSPIDGVVSAVRIHPGEAAMPGVPLFSITSLGGVYFGAAVSEKEKNQLTPGNPATITVDAVAGRTFAGKVSSILPVETAEIGGFELRVSLDRSETALPPGSSARAAVETASAAHALVIPLTAVVSEPDGQQSVFVVRNGSTVHRQPISTGITTASQVQVLTGLQPGQSIVTTGPELLHEGAAVTVSGR